MGIEAGRFMSISGLPEPGVMSETSGLNRSHLVEAGSLVFVRGSSDLGTSLNVASISLLITCELRLDASSRFLGYGNRE